MDSLPIGVLFAAIIILITCAIELGYKAGDTHPENSKKDKEKITSSNSAAILGILGFILVFTFGIVYSRYDKKKELVREEANDIRTAWLRSDFLQEQDRRETQVLLKKYVDLRIEIVNVKDEAKIPQIINESSVIQHQLWNITSLNPRKDMNSQLGALYTVSLNDMINKQALRVSVGLQTRIPTVILAVLFLLVVLGMFGVGYQASIAGSSRRSWLTPIMVLTFSLMITLVVALDRPNSDLMPVPQQPLIDLRAWME